MAHHPIDLRDALNDDAVAFLDLIYLIVQRMDHLFKCNDHRNYSFFVFKLLVQICVSINMLILSLFLQPIVLIFMFGSEIYLEIYFHVKNSSLSLELG